jgi:CubicO group peptidase (beta-lactamase class C family)
VPFFVCTEYSSVSVERTSSDWERSTFSAEDMDTGAMNAMANYINDSVKYPTSMVIVRNGKLLYEKYYRIFDADTTYHLFSTTKSVMSVLTGIAIGNGLIPGGVSAKVLDFFPEKTFDNMDSNKQDIAVEDLLTMRTGWEWDNDSDSYFYSHDPIKYILDKPIIEVPGTKWNYSDGAPHILSAIIEKMSGISTLQFAQKNLFDPLGIHDFYWWEDYDKRAIGGYGLFLKPKDLAKIGQLYLNNGIWNGKEIIKKEWIEKSTVSLTKTDWKENGSYGYLWWINDFGGYCSRGLYGQEMFIIPEKKLVVVFTSDINKFQSSKVLNSIMKKYIIPGSM